MGKFAHWSLTDWPKKLRKKKTPARSVISPSLYRIVSALKSFPFSFCINCVYARCKRSWEWFDKLFFFFPPRLPFLTQWNSRWPGVTYFHNTQGGRMHPPVLRRTHRRGPPECMHVFRRRTRTLKALYILDGSVSMTKCAPSHTALQIEPWFPLAASHTRLHTARTCREPIRAAANTHMHADADAHAAVNAANSAWRRS